MQCSSSPAVLLISLLRSYHDCSRHTLLQRFCVACGSRLRSFASHRTQQPPPTQPHHRHRPRTAASLKQQLKLPAAPVVPVMGTVCVCVWGTVGRCVVSSKTEVKSYKEQQKNNERTNDNGDMCTSRDRVQIMPSLVWPRRTR